MASKRILLLLDSERPAVALIKFLEDNARMFSWKVKAASFDSEVLGRLERQRPGEVEFTLLKKMQECEQAIKKSDLVIAMLPDTLMLQVADACIKYRKSMISPGRLTRQLALKKPEAKDANVLLLMDCGFSPGLDHIIAKKAIDNIHSRGGTVSSFRTFSGVLLSGKSESNPWAFKLTEPAAELLNWGKLTNRHLLNGRMQQIPPHTLFERTTELRVRDAIDVAAIPEGDSLYYKKIYDLNDAHTVIKGKLVRRGFERTWSILARLGLTDNTSRIDLTTIGSNYSLVDALLPLTFAGSIEERLMAYTGADASDIEKLRWLGLFDNTLWSDLNRELTPAQILQTLLTEKMSMQDGDADCLIMEHDLGYEFRDEHFEMKATLVVESDPGEDTALARVIGYTCGAAAKSVLLGTIKVKGVHIPILREIYDPILNELEELGIAFHMTEKKVATALDSAPVLSPHTAQ